MLGAFADRIDCWLLAEGIERLEELETVAALGVPLAQGYLLGRPGPPWASLPERLCHRLRELATPTNGDTIRAHLETCPTVGSIQAAMTLLASDDQLDVVVIVDDSGRPTGVADLDAAAIGTAARPLCVNLDTSVAQAVQRALRRPRSIRFMPVVATDNAGRYAGTAHIEGA